MQSTKLYYIIFSRQQGPTLVGPFTLIENMNQLDFRKNPVAAGHIIQPDFRIRGYVVEVNPSRGDYRLEVGCQKVTVTAKNVQNLLDEFNGVPRDELSVKLILSKKQVKDITSVVNIPKYLESSEAFLISTTKKVYPKELYTLFDHTYQPEGEYFTANKGRAGGTTKTGYELSGSEVKDIIFILDKLKEVLIPTVAETAVVEAPAITEPATSALPDVFAVKIN